MSAEVCDTFVFPCLTCGSTIRVDRGAETPHECIVPDTTQGLIARAWWAGHDAAAGGAR